MNSESRGLFIGWCVGVLTLYLLLSAAPLFAEENVSDSEEPLCIFRISKEHFPIKLCWAHKKDFDAGLPPDEKVEFFEPSKNELISIGGAGSCSAYILGTLVPGQGTQKLETQEEMHARYLREELDYFYETGKSKCFPGAKIVKSQSPKAKKEEVARLIEKLPEPKPAPTGDNTNPKVTYNNILQATLAPPDPVIKCLKVCFVLDRSGSMVDDIQFAGEQFSVLEKAWTERYPGCVEASVVGMGQNDKNIYVSSPLLSKQSVKELESVFTHFTHNGTGTEPIYDATNDCIQRLGQGLGATPEPGVFKSVVILTDEAGDPVDCSPSVSQVIKSARSSGTELHVIAPPQKDVKITSASFSSDGRRVVTGSKDGTARIWDVESGERITTLTGYISRVSSASFSPDGRRVVMSPNFGVARIWDVESGASTTTLTGHKGVTAANFAPDGRRVVTGSRDGTARIWDVESGERITTLTGYISRVSSASFSPDGRRVVTGSYDHTATIWNAETGARITTLTEHKDGVTTASFSPDGRRVVTGSFDDTAIIWNAESGERITTLTGHKGGVTTASFSPDGRRVITGSYDGTVIIWNAESGERIATLPGHKSGVTAASFSPDGTRVVTVSGGDRTVNIWNAKTGQLIKTVTLTESNNKECHESLFLDGQARLDNCGITRFDPKDTEVFECSRRPAPLPPQKASDRRDQKDLPEPSHEAPKEGVRAQPGK